MPLLFGGGDIYSLVSNCWKKESGMEEGTSVK